jgi:hypothetical protein
VGDVITNMGPAAAGTVGPQGLTGPKGDPGGWSASTIITTGTSFDNLITSGLYFNPVANASVAPGPTGVGGHLEVIGAANWIYQRYTPMGDTRGTYLRARNSSNIWTSWRIVDATRVDQTAGRVIYQWDDVNQRDQMIFADTGLRALTPENSYVGSVYLRRYGSVVTLIGTLQRPPGGSLNGKFITIPAGFGPASTAWIYTPVRHNGSSSVFWIYRQNTDILFSDSQAGTETDSSQVRFEVSWTSNSVWPTTLPGTAVGSIPNA